MKNTSITLTDAKCKKIIDALDNLQPADQDATCNQLREEIKQVRDIWKHIDIKATHRLQIEQRAKSKKGS